MLAGPHRRTLVGLSVQVFLGTLGFGLVLPVLPLFGQTFGASAWQIGVLIAAFGVGRLVSDVVGGPLADRVGRRALIVSGFVLITGGAVTSALAPTYVALLASRLVQGLGAGAQQIAGMAALAEVTPPEGRGRTLSVYQGSLLLGAMLGPALGGALDAWGGPRTAFLVYAAVTAAAALWAWRMPLAPTRVSAEPAAFAPIVRDRRFLWMNGAVFVTFLTRSGTQFSLLPLLGASALALDSAGIGLALGLLTLVTFLAVPASGVIADTIGRKAAVVPGALVLSLGLLALALAGSREAFFAGALVMGLGSGLTGSAPLAYITDLSPPGRHGTTIGLFRLIGDTGYVLGPILLGAVADAVGLRGAVLANAALVTASALGVAAFAREGTRRGRAGHPRRAAPGLAAQGEGGGEP